MNIKKIVTLAIALLALTACSQGSAGEEPTSEPANDQTGQVFIESPEILVRESYPMQVSLLLKGQLPTPCHELSWEVLEPNEKNEIHVSVNSIADPDAICTQVLEPFEVDIPLGDFTEYGYSVWVNGEKVGEF